MPAKSPCSALPKAWAAGGSFSGLRARGGYTVDCAWKDGKVTSYHIRGAKPGNVKANDMLSLSAAKQILEPGRAILSQLIASSAVK